MNNIAFGKYVPNNTFSHKLDARNKLFLAICLIVMVFFQFKSMQDQLILSHWYLIIFVLLMLISRVSILELFRSLAGMWFLIIFLFAVYIFIPTGNYGSWSIEAFRFSPSYIIYWGSFYSAFYIIVRLVLMIEITMILTTTTKPTDLTYGFEWYMTPLKLVRFPVSEIAMTLSLALRFIPTLLEETNRIMKAQASRGVDFNHGGLFKRFKAVISLIVPLFVNSIERSEELANAMIVRGYNPKAKRTRFKTLSFSYRDIIALLVVLALLGGVITLFVFDRNSENGINIIQFIFKTDWKLWGLK